MTPCTCPTLLRDGLKKAGVLRLGYMKRPAAAGNNCFVVQYLKACKRSLLICADRKTLKKPNLVKSRNCCRPCMLQTFLQAVLVLSLYAGLAQEFREPHDRVLAAWLRGLGAAAAVAVTVGTRCPFGCRRPNQPYNHGVIERDVKDGKARPSLRAPWPLPESSVRFALATLNNSSRAKLLLILLIPN